KCGDIPLTPSPSVTATASISKGIPVLVTKIEKSLLRSKPILESSERQNLKTQILNQIVCFLSKAVQTLRDQTKVLLGGRRAKSFELLSQWQNRRSKSTTSSNVQVAKRLPAMTVNRGCFRDSEVCDLDCPTPGQCTTALRYHPNKLW